MAKRTRLKDVKVSSKGVSKRVHSALKRAVARELDQDAKDAKDAKGKFAKIVFSKKPVIVRKKSPRPPKHR